jgi:hypothetical protein
MLLDTYSYSLVSSLVFDGKRSFYTSGVKLPKIIVLEMTSTNVLYTITLLNLNVVSPRFSTRPNAMAPLMKAAHVAKDISFMLSLLLLLPLQHSNI